MKAFAMAAILAAVTAGQEIQAKEAESVTPIYYKPRRAFCKMRYDITNPTTFPHGYFKLY